jgi:hypothetical protein
MILAPVIIFNYNRPDHSQHVWDALSRNELAKETELCLYCDGPKANASDEMRQRIAKLHEQAKQYAIDAPKEGKFKAVHVVCADVNKGLANSIIGGVSEVIAMHGRVIVLEDDLLTSPYFLKYINEGLERYDTRKSVFTICANRPPVNKMQIPVDYEYDVFVSQRVMSTGWATWKDRWKQVDWSMMYLDELKRHPYQVDAINRCGRDLMWMLELQRDGKIDSWAVQYCYAHFANHAVAILPCVPYVDNIGFDGTGVHCADIGNEIQNDLSLAPKNPRMPNSIYEDSRIINAFYNYYCHAKRPIWQRVINTIYRQLGKQAPFVIKKKIYVE